MSQVNPAVLRNSLSDPNFNGEGYRASMEIRQHGPLKERKCTDVIFCLLFIAFCVVFTLIYQFALNNGRPDILLSPVD